MIRVDSIFSCAEKHRIDTTFLLYLDEKSKKVKTLENSFKFSHLFNNKKFNLLVDFENLRVNYNKIKNKLNQYFERHRLLTLSARNKYKIEELLEKARKLSQQSFINQNLELSEYNKTINNISSKIDDFKKTLLDYKKKFPDKIKSDTILSFKVISKTYSDFIPIDNDSYYVIVKSGDYEISKVSLYFKTLNTYNITGINSIVPKGGYYEIYLENINKKALENIVLYVLLIEKG